MDDDLARALGLVLRCVEVARRAGPDPVVLRAAASHRPREPRARLGFDEIGDCRKAIRSRSAQA